MNTALPVAEQNGLYLAPADLAPLRRAVRDAGLSWRVIDLRRVRGKRALLAAFARDFAFPETFGGNWDALADCLQDLSWRTEPGWIVQLRGAAVFAAAAPDDYDLLHGILGATVDYWRGRRRVFMVLAEDGAGLPAWPAR